MQNECGHRGLRFALLGPVRASWHAEELHVGPPQQRALLAALLLRGGRAATAAELVDDIWGENPPDQAVAALRNYASGLRRALGSSSGLLVSKAGGYALLLQRSGAVIDVDTVTELTAEARQAEDSRDWDWARELYGMALAHWQGQPLAHIPGPFAYAHRVRLQEWHLNLLEHRTRLDLQRGCHASVIGELTALTALHPLRENLRDLLMLALYRDGRQAEALAVYHDIRRLLGRELGISPGPRLQSRHHQILNNDTELDRCELSTTV